MVFVKIQKSNIDGKKYTATFYDENKKKIKTKLNTYKSKLCIQYNGS